MKEVVIKIPDVKFTFFMELVKQLGFEVYQKYDVPEEQISLVMDRMQKSEKDSDRLENWDNIKDDFRLDA